LAQSERLRGLIMPLQQFHTTKRNREFRTSNGGNTLSARALS
jgi:hypothetical protein